MAADDLDAEDPDAVKGARHHVGYGFGWLVCWLVGELIAWFGWLIG